MGQLVAEWVVEGTPSLDVWHMDSRRFGAAYRSREYTLARTTEIYETYYDVTYPGHERSAGRPLRVSPAYERLAELGAVVRREVGLGARQLVRAERGRTATSRCGRAAGRASTGRPRSAPSTAPAGRPWRSSTSRRSPRSTSAAQGAAAFLESLCANRVARDVGAVTYTQMLNARGGIECDFTVTRLAEERFRIVTGTAFGQHDLAWIRQHAPRDGSVHVADVTSALACLGVWGPNARALLQPLTTTDLSNDALRLHAGAGALDRRRPVPRGPGHLRRRARLGALLPAEFGGRLWDTIWAAGARARPRRRRATRRSTRSASRRATACGAPTSRPRRRRSQRASASPSSSTRETFLGRDALVGKQEPEHVLRCLTLDDPRAVALGSEPVRVGDRLVGRVTSGGYGYTVERSIAYAYLPAADADVGTGSRSRSSASGSSGEVAAEPLYDPEGARIRA